MGDQPAIATREEVKSILGIHGDTLDSKIDMLLPIVQDDLLAYLNNYFRKPNGIVEYPPALKLYMARMINFRIIQPNENIKSESLSRHSVTYSSGAGENISGYPADIMLGLSKWRKLKWM